MKSGVYSFHRKWFLFPLCCFVCFSMAACIHTIFYEPPDFDGTPKPEPIVQPAPPQLTGDPERPYLLQTQPPFTVALDAGHGGMDTGAEAIVTELPVCENTVDALYALLDADPNFYPIRTRPNGQDLSIKDRTQTATDAGAAILLSVHANSDKSAPSAYGFECFPAPPGRVYAEESMQLAKCIAQQFGESGQRLRGESGIRFAYYNGKSKRIVDASDTSVHTQKSFGMLEYSHCPAVLIEQCFLTNQSDVNTWATPEGCTKAAQLYYNAICAYFGTTPIN